MFAYWFTKYSVCAYKHSALGIRKIYSEMFVIKHCPTKTYMYLTHCNDYLRMQMITANSNKTIKMSSIVMTMDNTELPWFVESAAIVVEL